MLFRQLSKVATFTAFIFLSHTSPLLAQRARRTAIPANYENTYPGHIAGKISADNGTPMSGVNVSLIHEGKVAINVTTGATGTFEFKDITAGRYTISCFKTDYTKRIINSVPVIENCISRANLKLYQVETWKDERFPTIQTFEELKHHSVERAK